VETPVPTADEEETPILLAIAAVTPAAARASLARLSVAERARVAGIRHSGRADAVAVSLALARRVLAAVTGLPAGELEFTRTCERCGHPTHGRPRLDREGVEFSVSRSERWAAVAVAPVPVGVDVEDPGRAVAAGELAPVLSAAERSWLAGREADDLLVLFVMKESVGKAMGLGIVDVEELSVVSREGDELTGWRAVVDPSARRWSVTRVDAPGAVLAVAIAGNPRPIRVRRGSDTPLGEPGAAELTWPSADEPRESR
jgi:phosphopantetheinyl transferase